MNQKIMRLKIIKGPYKGISYKLVSNKITIGRSTTNDIVLEKDNKCSRKQVIIQLDNKNNYIIKDLSKKSSLKINNIVRLKTDLQDGDLIQFGNTILQCEVTTNSANNSANMSVDKGGLIPLSSDNNITVNNSNETDSQKPPLGDYQNPYGSISTDNTYKTPAKKKSGMGFKIILIIISFLGLYLFLDQAPEQKPKKDKMRTSQDVQDNLKTLKELKEIEQKKRNKNALPTYKNAQAAFITGRRDYRKGLYNRATEAFRVCKTLYPKHQLCHSYLRKSEIKNQQLIQAWMIAGKEFRIRRRYISCISSFKNVMITIQNKNNLIYKEAAQNYKICQIKHSNRN